MSNVTQAVTFLMVALLIAACSPDVTDYWASMVGMDAGMDTDTGTDTDTNSNSDADTDSDSDADTDTGECTEDAATTCDGGDTDTTEWDGGSDAG